MYSNHQQSIGTMHGSLATNNYIPPNTSRFSVATNHNRRNSNGTKDGGNIEKTNMMSSENPFVDPARPFEHFSSPRSITSITSPRKNDGSLNKSLNLSDENPFHAIYGNYRYPVQIDPSKKITSQSTANRSIDSKSLHMSGENPFSKTYERYQQPTQTSPPKYIPEIPKVTESYTSSNGLSHSNSFSSYRPSLIRQYSAGDIGLGFNSISTSIADWERNNPAPLSYRPIPVQRPPPEYYSYNKSSYNPPSSPPRQQQQQQVPPLQLSPRSVAPLTSTSFQVKKPNMSAPLDKTSLNMSPDNPFASTYGRYYYPSPEEIKSQKRESERTVRFADEVPTNENRTTQSINQITERSEPEKKDVNTGKSKMKATRFDIEF
ncbi:unnamed protein product [Adineta steineri]|uniref:Uncharacterized protein n=1 Tax=Adineta steineri TaxID=433720 RepID=A0A819N442_9BILA|nr:unnamed protein product [Adineta steineri]CAF3989162.1 unnamed protein product [Adineta steineri]